VGIFQGTVELFVVEEFSYVCGRKTSIRNNLFTLLAHPNIFTDHTYTPKPAWRGTTTSSNITVDVF
jgi:hypothetical protein